MMQRGRRGGMLEVGLELGVAVALIVSAPLLCLANPLVLTEFMAANDRTLADEDGDFSDWIEVGNVSDEIVNYGGWSLTDDASRLAHWELPDGELGPRESLIVFASGKDRAVPGAELHTNFKLSEFGEYLALVEPNKVTIASQYRPRYPPQFGTASFGVAPLTDITQLAGASTTVRFFVPTDDALGEAWREPDFDDSAWAEAVLPVGFDDRDESLLSPLVATDLAGDMLSTSSSVFLRLAVTVDDSSRFASLVLRLRYADGFILYVNGEEVVRRGMTGTPLWFSTGRRRRDGEIVETESIDLSEVLGRLRAGRNVIAIHAANNSPLDSVFLFAPELDAIAVLDPSGPLEYFPAPSPGWTNTDGLQSVAAVPEFSIPSGTIDESATLELTSVTPDAVIRYTVDRTSVHEFSPIYSEPIAVNAHQEVRARVFAPGFAPSPTSSRHYIVLVADAASFSSDLPIVIVQSFGRGINDGYVDANILVLEPGADGRTSLVGAATVASAAAIKTRGSSSGVRTKSSYRLEFRDERGRDRGFRVLGMPLESDWILYGAFNFDHAHMRNPLIYRLSNEAGRWAARTKYCELFVDFNGAGLIPANYFGIYSFMESVKRDVNRVDIQELYQGHAAEPEISGGYIVKIDRTGPSDRIIPVAGNNVITNEPSGPDITPEQEAWIDDFMNAFVASLSASDVADPDVPLEAKSYAAFIDIDAWIDHHLLNVFAKNVDALRLSTYFFKDRQGLLQAGPIWDFDRSMGSTDGRDRAPDTWVGSSDATRYFDYPWWRELMDDPVFWERYKARWFELRQGPFRTANFVRIIDGWAAELSEASARDSAQWNQYTPDGFFAAVDHLKSWLSTRATWIDSQFLPVPVISPAGGFVQEGTEVTIDVEGPGQIYYTLTGEDPKTDLDAISPNAILYTGPFLITQNSRVTARLRVDGLGWSLLVEDVYATSLPKLIVSEIMYNPAPLPDGEFRISDYEYLELQNTGDEPIVLPGVRVAFAPRATFTGQDVDGNDLAVLQPGEHLLVVKNLEAFRSRYDAEGVIVANEYDRRNSSLANGGQEIVLFGSVGEEILRFAYDEEWHPSTNAGGYSLVAVDPLTPRDRWGEVSSWRPSYRLEGSPGRPDVKPESLQRPADMTQDGRVDVADGIGMIRYLFAGGASPCATQESTRTLLDSNGDAQLNLADVLYVLNYVFARGAPPAQGVECLTILECPAVCP